MINAKYQTEEGDKIRCTLCPNQCIMAEGEKGRCLARGFFMGQLKALSYSRVVAASTDPVEKKPLYHVSPGRPIFSVGGYGCNLSCNFCQNSDISQDEQPSVEMLPQQLLERALSIKDNIGVAFTYNEPGIWFEYILDCAPLLKKRQMLTVMVTNGYLSPEPFAQLCDVVDAMNIDLKAFNSEFYQKQCGGDLETVKQNIITAHEKGVHLELTNLLIPGLNTDEKEFCKMLNWIKSISEDIPLHISRYFPRYKSTIAATDADLVKHFAELANKYLRYVYCGNLGSEENTLCPSCSRLLVSRHAWASRRVIKGDKCQCGMQIPMLDKPGEREAENE